MIARNHPNFEIKDIIHIFKNILLSDKDVSEVCIMQLKNILKFKYIIFASYARASIKLILEALEIKNSKIIIPAYICRVVAYSIVLSGNTPQFADIDSDNFTINSDINLLIDEHTKVIIPALIYGNPYKLNEKIINNEQILLIEDASMAFGNENLESYSRKNSICVFSFNIGKVLSTISGSLICTNDENLYLKIHNYIKNLDTSPAYLENFICLIKFLIIIFLFNDKFYNYIFKTKHNRLLRKYTEDTSTNNINLNTFIYKDMSKFQKLLLISQINKYDFIQNKHIELFDHYTNNLKNIESIRLPKFQKNSSLSHYTILAENRNELYNFLINNGVECNLAYNYSVPHLKDFKKFADTKFSYNNADEIAKKSLCLPFYSKLKFDDIHRISKLIKKFYNYE